MNYGYRSEFEVWPLGLVIALATAFIGWVFAAPGAVKIYADKMTDEINGKISIAGPMANMALALVFLAIAALIYPLKSYSIVSFRVSYDEYVTVSSFNIHSFLVKL